jgi:hypothetical protein
MSKPLVQYVRHQATVAKSGSLIKDILRMGLYWLCATMLLWSNAHPLMDWHLATVGWFYLSSTLLVPVLGYASYWLRGSEAGADYQSGDKIPHSFAVAITQAGLLILDLFMILMTVVSVERLLF